VVDLSDGCGSKFKAVIVSPQFEGKPTRIIPALNVSVISERKVPVQYLFLIQYLK
jgi:hypothetical protein